MQFSQINYDINMYINGNGYSQTATRKSVFKKKDSCCFIFLKLKLNTLFPLPVFEIIQALHLFY